MSESITVIGIDPGSRNMGWGVVREVSGVLRLVDCGVIRPPLKGEFAERLGFIFRELHNVVGPSEAGRSLGGTGIYSQERRQRRLSSDRPGGQPLRRWPRMIFPFGITSPRSSKRRLSASAERIRLRSVLWWDVYSASNRTGRWIRETRWPRLSAILLSAVSNGWRVWADPCPVFLSIIELPLEACLYGSYPPHWMRHTARIGGSPCVTVA